jgi:non-ribosomal peptide synthetase component F
MMYAILNILLHRLTGQDDVVIGAPIATRNCLETEEMIGLFLNNLVIRTRLTQSLTLSDLLAQVREVTLAAYDNQELPFEKLVEELRPDRQLSYAPLFQVFLNVSALAVETPLTPELSARRDEPRPAIPSSI